MIFLCFAKIVKRNLIFNITPEKEQNIPELVNSQIVCSLKGSGNVFLILQMTSAAYVPLPLSTSFPSEKLYWKNGIFILLLQHRFDKTITTVAYYLFIAVVITANTTDN